MRLFLALDLDDGARDAVAAVAGRLSDELARAREPRAVKWVEPENLHVTVRFLGKVDEEAYADLERSLSRPLPVRPFTLGIGTAGCFPPSGDPRVVWVGVTHGVDSARAIYQRLDERLLALNYASEAREYRPHVTLGRVRELSRAGGRKLRQWTEGVAPRLAEVQIVAVTLYRSQLSSRGPRYEPMLRTELRP